MNYTKMTLEHIGYNKSSENEINSIEKVKGINFPSKENQEIVRILGIIEKIRLTSSTLPDGILRVRFKNFCDGEVLDYLNRKPEEIKREIFEKCTK